MSKVINGQLFIESDCPIARVTLRRGARVVKAGVPRARTRESQLLVARYKPAGRYGRGIVSGDQPYQFTLDDIVDLELINSLDRVVRDQP